jgi:hypothetical protein
MGPEGQAGNAATIRAAPPNWGNGTRLDRFSAQGNPEKRKKKPLDDPPEYDYGAASERQILSGNRLPQRKEPVWPRNSKN